MEFKDRDAAHHFFSFYGFLAGFEVVVAHVARTSAKKKNNEIYKQEMKCHRYGKQSKKEEQIELADETLLREASNDDKAKRKTNVQVRTDCKCVMVVKVIAGIWKVIRLDLEHNHELSPKDRNQLFSGRKYMTNMEKGIIRTLNDNNIPTRKMIAILSYLRGGLTALPYKTKNVQNMRTKINREVTGNDMTQAMEYFRKRKMQDSTFYFRFQVDNDMKVKNIFWREGISLKWYAEYGDCISFDTTYMTNRYNLPFAPFVGITGHAHTSLLASKIDQDKAMRSAIEKVFPNSKHRNCFFHIKSKCYNKNLRCFAVNKGLPEKFEDIVYFSVTEDEFEMLWQGMIAEYKLEKNKYFNKMWETRKRIIPVYFKNDFFPFIQSTGRSEGTNARTKKIVDTIKNKEEIEDNFNKQKMPKEIQYGYTIEQQAVELYNRNIYIKFSNQLRQTKMYKYKETEKGRCFERIRKYIVLTDLTEGCEEFSCICGKFNKDGILCAHILKVIVEEEINKISEKYFIDRWRKKEKKFHIPKDIDGNATHELLRFNMLSRKAALLTSKGAKTKEGMQYLDEEFERLNKHLDFLLEEKERQTTLVITEQSEIHHDDGGSISNNVGEIVILQDPKRIQQKGRPKNPTRLKPLVEQERAKMAKAAAKKNKKQQQTSSKPHV
ncbi:hypothetical protein PVAP13_4KG163815 [Panicum virgatum]|uniref:Protein FAR1-RELATED SEQUENCE n=1 Tax=Panicum virgatum TaxID=38727 RepID=A0A8T0TQW3_PANVG|nr:hypothetical protein PVAP13_4KG163815 [Panicum virgatum]